ncbi:hypothetical protein ACOSQ2_027120 [Xanthoceras sorbifolium]
MTLADFVWRNPRPSFFLSLYFLFRLQSLLVCTASSFSRLLVHSRFPAATALATSSFFSHTNCCLAFFFQQLLW